MTQLILNIGMYFTDKKVQIKAFFNPFYLTNPLTHYSTYQPVHKKIIIFQSVLEGYNATIMAYGQTGSGKSFSMQEDPDHIGIIPRAIVHVFQVRLLK